MWVYSHIQDFENYSPNVSNKKIQDFKRNIEERIINLKDYLLKTIDKNIDILSAEEIQNHLFPCSSEQHIFLSHSHKDENKVIALAVALEEKGFKVFVDSCVWGNAFELLRAVDDEYCKQGNSMYFDYHKRNISTANIYMILNTALHNMIDKCELVFFLNTPNSVLENLEMTQQTISSPWIFSELSFATKVKRRSIFSKGVSTESSYDSLNEQNEFKIAFSLPKADYTIPITNINTWLNSCADYKNTEDIINKNLLDFYRMINRDFL